MDNPPIATEATEVTTVEAQPVQELPNGELFLIAEDTKQMQVCMDATKGVMKKRLTELQEELDDLNNSLAVAKKNKWQTAGFKRAIKKAEQRVVYYQKLGDALDAGYHIVPNFPGVNVWAVRRETKVPKRKWQCTRYASGADSVHEGDKKLESGEGEYFDPESRVSTSENRNRESDKVMNHTHYLFDLEDPAFPMKLAKPQIMAAAGHAMAAKIFDEIGLIDGTEGRRSRRRGDPILVGRLIDPRSTTYNKRYCTFIIGWCLDTNDL